MNDVDIAKSRVFNHLLRVKRRLLLPLTLSFLAFYFTLPILTSYSHALNATAFSGVSWAWVFALAQFPMTWLVCSVYTRQAKRFDTLAHQIRETCAEDAKQAET